MRASKQPEMMQTRKSDNYLRPKVNTNIKNPEVSATVLRQRPNNIGPATRRQANSQNTEVNIQPTTRKGLSAYRFTKSLTPTQSKSAGHKPISPPAPSSQFKKYLSDTENIFYQDSYNMRALRYIKSAKLYLSFLLLIMVMSYILIGRIVPFPREKCPKYAVCNVFIHCHQGYVLNNGRCDIDPDIIDKANSISTAVISQLSYNYGDTDCLSQPERQSYSINIQDVLREFNVEGDMLRQEVLYFFMSKSNQAEHQFSYRANQITAQRKQYSLTCSTTIFILSQEFKYYLIAVILSIFGGVKMLKRRTEWNKAREIYTFLKRRTLTADELCISSAKREGESLYGNWTADLWMKVDQLRYEDSCISYYVDQEELYWKRVD